MKKTDIAVIGAGPAGLMAAISASVRGANVCLLEKNPALGRKLLLTGNGRCNFTNTAPLESFISKFGRNGKFLRDAYNCFPPSVLMGFFEKRGLACRVEGGGRVFPSTERSSDILAVLERETVNLNVKTLVKEPVSDLVVKSGSISGVKLSGGGTLSCRAVILATGGVSYPSTGSTGDGFRMARQTGHSFLPPKAGLVPIVVKENHPSRLKGVSLCGVAVTVISGGKKIKKEKGDVIFTAKGLSGPAVLSASGSIADELSGGKEVFLELDLFPDSRLEEISDIIASYSKTSPSRRLKNCFNDSIPKRLAEFLVSLSLSDGEKTCNQITRSEKFELARLFKALRFTVTSTCPIDEAMVTVGGISLGEIDPKTMSSRIVEGLYFAGEIIDVDGDTGGFNLQAAFSTGYLAGISSAELVLKS
ncbi:MAG TPA: NAD(P)/FAD-dependent oxidoreductase [Candidatus Omnitrophota bacterium]|nr:NAD(P)/FAD-dependent oxidoreductase [Candidatus Omnitrophota bacterium]